MLLLAAALHAHAAAPLPPPDKAAFETGAIERLPPVRDHASALEPGMFQPEADLLDGRRYTRASYLNLPSGNSGATRLLPEGQTLLVPLHTEPLDRVPAQTLRDVVSLVPGMLPTRHGVMFGDGGSPALYVDGLRWERSPLLGP
ncbi:MAG: hypothetical protein Q8P41_15005 [Pseudomonadota bacterium]|nr:hypothetical protein [Pseudomonadota bacterium]